MGAGRRPKPTMLKRLAGNPGGRRLNANEPQPVWASAENAPVWLTPAGRMVWRDMAPKLERAGLLTELDERLLGLFCESFAMYLAARKSIGKTGESRRTGQVKPALTLMKGALNTAIRLGVEFGLTPASRSRLSVKPPQEESQASKFFGFGNGNE